MELTKETKQSQVKRRLKEIKKETLLSEKRFYRIALREYKEGIFPLAPTKPEEAVENCMDCNSEVQELKAWLLGYEAHKRLSQTNDSRKGGK